MFSNGKLTFLQKCYWKSILMIQRAFWLSCWIEVIQTELPILLTLFNIILSYCWIRNTLLSLSWYIMSSSVFSTIEQKYCLYHGLVFFALYMVSYMTVMILYPKVLQRDFIGFLILLITDFFLNPFFSSCLIAASLWFLCITIYFHFLPYQWNISGS